MQQHPARALLQLQELRGSQLDAHCSDPNPLIRHQLRPGGSGALQGTGLRVEKAHEPKTSRRARGGNASCSPEVSSCWLRARGLVGSESTFCHGPDPCVHIIPDPLRSVPACRCVCARLHPEETDVLCCALLGPNAGRLQQSPQCSSIIQDTYI